MKWVEDGKATASTGSKKKKKDATTTMSEGSKTKDATATMSEGSKTKDPNLEVQSTEGNVLNGNIPDMDASK